MVIKGEQWYLSHEFEWGYNVMETKHQDGDTQCRRYMTLKPVIFSFKLLTRTYLKMKDTE